MAWLKVAARENTMYTTVYKMQKLQQNQKWMNNRRKRRGRHRNQFKTAKNLGGSSIKEFCKQLFKFVDANFLLWVSSCHGQLDYFPTLYQRPESCSLLVEYNALPTQLLQALTCCHPSWRWPQLQCMTGLLQGGIAPPAMFRNPHHLLKH